MGEFLPLLVVIVVGLISTFSKMKGQNQGNPGKPMVPPQLDPMHPKHFEGKMTQRKETPTQSTTIPKNKPVIKNETMTLSEVRTKSIPPKSTQTVAIKVEEPVENSTHYLKNINKKKLIEGVIMAEVLGPPRALKPHSTNFSQKLPK